MGALKYVEELQKKKQSDVLRFLLRVRCWEVSSPAFPDMPRAKPALFEAIHSWHFCVLLYTR